MASVGFPCRDFFPWVVFGPPLLDGRSSTEFGPDLASGLFRPTLHLFELRLSRTDCCFLGRLSTLFFLEVLVPRDKADSAVSRLRTLSLSDKTLFPAPRSCTRSGFCGASQASGHGSSLGNKIAR